MVQYKLMYFNTTGRGETTRMLFALAGVEYEDFRIDRKNSWPADYQKEMPFGKVPVLVIDSSTKIGQSKAIERYLARKFGFAGKNELEEARVDMIAYTLDDMLQILVTFFREENEEIKNEFKKKALEEKFPFYFECLEKILKENMQSDQYLVGDEVTWADVKLVATRESISFFDLDPVDLSQYPRLQAHNEHMRAIPRLAEWIEKRKSI